MSRLKHWWTLRKHRKWRKWRARNEAAIIVLKAQVEIINQAIMKDES